LPLFQNEGHIKYSKLQYHESYPGNIRELNNSLKIYDPLRTRSPAV